jgi:hypothetical protein
MTAEQAAKHLDERLRQYPWYVSVGVGEIANGKALFVYVKSLRHPQLKSKRPGTILADT